MKIQSLTIGIPIRNEEKSLPIFIKTFKIALERLNQEFSDIAIELFFCLNDTTDKSEEILNLLLIENVFNNPQIIKSKKGKINALVEIIKNRKFLEGYLCFIDADIELEEFCIVNLLKELLLDSRVFLTYSSVHPKKNGSTNLIQIIQSTHYLLRGNINQRRYFHGRAYLMRSSFFLEKNLKTSSNLYWNLEEGPLVDDIYLSRLIIHTYGLDSIKESVKSKLWFLPPKSLKDFYFGQRRLLLEIKRLDLLYPEHSYIQKSFFKKNIFWSYFLKKDFKYLYSYLVYYFMEESVRLIIRIEMLMISLKLIKCKKIWKPLKTTKNWE